jgi:formyltetrahydrofolate synthetase
MNKELVAKPNMPALKKGFANLAKQIENVTVHGVPAVVAINRFTTDTDEEVAFIIEAAKNAGAADAVLSEVWAKGSGGGRELAEAVVKAVGKPHQMKLLYPDSYSIKQKIETIAKTIYGADGVDYLPEAEKKIKLYSKLGYDRLPINMAKTHLSLSHDPTLKGAPKGFRIPVRDIRASVGAGFLYPILGDMRTMPGLPSVPAAAAVDLDAQGRPMGLF